MAMLTQVIDAGSTEPRKMPNGWGWWHVGVLTTALEAEGAEFKQAFSPGWTFRETHTFTDEADGEVFTVSPGDTFRWWWS